VQKLEKLDLVLLFIVSICRAFQGFDLGVDGALEELWVLLEFLVNCLKYDLLDILVKDVELGYSKPCQGVVHLLGFWLWLLL
jgi:hypothetical protein